MEGREKPEPEKKRNNFFFLQDETNRLQFSAIGVRIMQVHDSLGVINTGGAVR